MKAYVLWILMIVHIYRGQNYEKITEIKIQNGDILFVNWFNIWESSVVEKFTYEMATINPQIIVLKEIQCNKNCFGILLNLIY